MKKVMRYIWQMYGWRMLVCACLIFNFQFSISNSANAQDTRYETDSTCGCDILYVDGIQTTRSGDRYGFKRADGTVIAEDIFLHVASFSDGYCRVWLEDSLCGLLDTSGRLVVPCLYDNVEQPSCGRALVLKNHLYGFSDLHGKLVIPIVFPHAFPFSDNRAAVIIPLDSFFYQGAYIDTLGNLLTTTPFQNTLAFTDGFAPVQQYDRWGIVDTFFNIVLPTVHEQVSLIGEGLLFAGDGYGMALYDLRRSKRPLTPPHYLPVTPLSEGRIGVSRGNKYGFLDPLGNEVIPCTYDEIGTFRLGRAMARIGDRFGIIDTSGRIVLPIVYEDRTPKGYKYVYYDSVALVERDGKLGFVDLEGRFVVPLSFSQAYHFSQGLAPVRLDNHWGYINNRGDIYLPFIFDIASPFRYGRAEVFLLGNRHKIDLQGRCLTNCNGIISFR